MRLAPRTVYKSSIRIAFVNRIVGDFVAIYQHSDKVFSLCAFYCFLESSHRLLYVVSLVCSGILSICAESFAMIEMADALNCCWGITLNLAIITLLLTRCKFTYTIFRFGYSWVWLQLRLRFKSWRWQLQSTVYICKCDMPSHSEQARTMFRELNIVDGL